MRRAWLSLVLLLAWALPAQAAITVLGSASSASGTNVAMEPYTGLTYTTPAGSDRLLVLVVALGDAVFADAGATAVTYGGQAMTEQLDANDANWVRVQIWTLLEAGIAAAGSTTFSITGGASHPDILIVGAVAYSGVHQTVTFGTPASASGSSATASVAVSSATGEVVIAAISSDSEAGITETGTLIFEVEGVGSDVSGGGQSYAGAASVTAQWGQSNTGWVVGGIALKPAAGGGAPPTSKLMLLGVGGGE